MARDGSTSITNGESLSPLPASPVAAATWIASGAILIALALLLRLTSPALAESALHHLTNRNLLVAGNVLAGTVFLLSCLFLRRPMGKHLWIWMLLSGMLCRVILLGGTPVLSTDYYRFLWDGAVLAQGQNPWRYSPQAVLNHTQAGVPVVLTAMAQSHRQIMQHINHAKLATIYPPVSELAMALAAKISPFSATALRCVYLLFDCATAAAIALMLRRLKRPMSWLLIYWWNPVLINAFYNEAHMDVITLAFVALFALMLIRQRPKSAAALLGLAIGAKFWPVVLAPLLLRPLLGDMRKCVTVGLVLALVTAAALAPMFLTGAPAIRSLLTYGGYWHDNDGVFRLISLFWQWAFSPSAYIRAALAARASIAVIYLAALFFLNRRSATGSNAIRIGLFSVMFIFLLSPTEFAWYYTWLLPLLAVYPRISLLIWSLTLGLYHAHYFYPWMIWVEHGPVWALLIIEAFQPRVANWFVGLTERQARPAEM